MNLYTFELIDSYGHTQIIEQSGHYYEEALKTAMKKAYSAHLDKYPTLNVWFQVENWTWKEAR